MFRSAASPSTQSEEIKNPITSLITSPALGAWRLEAVCTGLGEGSSDLRAMAAQCENVAPVIDCAPTHATICSGDGLSGLVNGDVVGGVLSEVAAGGGHPPADTCAPAGRANINASPNIPSSKIQWVLRTVSKDIPHPGRRAGRSEGPLAAWGVRCGYGILFACGASCSSQCSCSYSFWTCAAYLGCSRSAASRSRSSVTEACGSRRRSSGSRWMRASFGSPSSSSGAYAPALCTAPPHRSDAKHCTLMADSRPQVKYEAG
jgi:hypothetical protein